MKFTVFTSILLAAGISTPLAAAPETPDDLGEAFCAAVAAEDSSALGELYTDDADSYGPAGDIVKGRDAIEASWAPFFESFDNLTCTLDKAGEAKNKKNHTAWGLWTMTGTPAGGGDTIVMNGRYMDISVKMKDGWRYRADHASMSAPPAAE